MKTEASGRPDFAITYANLGSPRFGTVAVAASDEFFAPKERMLQDAEPQFDPDLYDDNGKWMDGWESRRKRGPGNDWCLIRLGVTAIVRGLDIDTRHFTGNYPQAARLEGTLSEDRPADAAFVPLMPVESIGPDAHHFVAIDHAYPVNWLKLHIYPDGGIARLRIYGQPVPQWHAGDPRAVHELSALANGGRIVAYNDAHYGDPWAILAPGSGVNTGDGWETRRRREPGHDWIIVALGHVGRIERIEVDTACFKGNYPDVCSVQAALVSAGTTQSIITQSMFWDEILATQKLGPDANHVFGPELLAPSGPVTHLRLAIRPDGGISRFRVFGRLAA
jgi:allantoicase